MSAQHWLTACENEMQELHWPTLGSTSAHLHSLACKARLKTQAS